jgi:hypothetical protein
MSWYKIGRELRYSLLGTHYLCCAAHREGVGEVDGEKIGLTADGVWAELGSRGNACRHGYSSHKHKQSEKLRVSSYGSLFPPKYPVFVDKV